MDWPAALVAGVVPPAWPNRSFRRSAEQLPSLSARAQHSSTFRPSHPSRSAQPAFTGSTRACLHLHAQHSARAEQTAPRSSSCSPACVSSGTGTPNGGNASSTVAPTRHTHTGTDDASTSTTSVTDSGSSHAHVGIAQSQTRLMQCRQSGTVICDVAAVATASGLA